MKNLTNWIKSRQVTAFFLITFGITWGLGFSYSAVLSKGIVLMLPLAAVATCGPALAGIIISATTNTQPKQGSRKTPWTAFLVAWFASALVWLAFITFSDTVSFSPALIVFALVTVIPVAFIMSMAYSRIPAVKTYMSSLVRPRGVLGWSLLAIVLFPALILLSMFPTSLLGRQPIAAYRLLDTDPALIGLVAIRFFYQFFFFNATGEETGWRGFALPRLQARTSPLIASLVLAFFWVPWHFFLWQAEGRPVVTPQYWIGQYAIHIPATFIIVWLFNRARGSILVAGIVHAAANTATAFSPNLDLSVFNWTAAVAALVMILADRMWKKLPSDHPAVYREHAPSD